MVHDYGAGRKTTTVIKQNNIQTYHTTFKDKIQDLESQKSSTLEDLAIAQSISGVTSNSQDVTYNLVEITPSPISDMVTCTYR